MELIKKNYYNMENFSVQGVVTNVISRNKDNIIFSIKTLNNLRYQVLCTFFCPVQDNDDIFIAECMTLDTMKIKALTQPLVSISMEKDKIKQYFLKTLRGTGFGEISANKLYDHIYKLANEFRYGENYKSDSVEEEMLSLDMNSKYLGDGVSAFLSEFSAKYHETYTESIPAMLGSTLENKINSGINMSQAKKLLIDWYNKRSLRKLYLLGLTKNEIQNSGVSLDRLYNICLENPYRIPSIKYEKCSIILNSMRRSSTEEYHCCGRINRFVYDYVHSKGYSCVPEATLRRYFPNYDLYSSKVFEEYYLVKLNTNVYLEKTYKIETAVSNYMDMLIKDTAISFNNDKSLFPDNFNNKIMNNFYHCKTLTDEQKRAITGALNCKISIITGGAGTGKSLVIKEITRNLDIREKSYCVCAFTGKAVSRLHQIMQNGIATTIDRLILNIYKNITKIPNTIIIDEGSMVTTELFYRLINSMPNKLVNVIIVGDCNQLPPIGWGNLMRELINSNRVPLFYLTKNQRIIATEETADRYILENANNLIDKNRSLRTPLKFNQGTGFYIVPGDILMVQAIVAQLYQANYNLSNLLILSPYKTYLDSLNNIVQNTYLNNSFKYNQDIRTGTRLWCVGDRVMMTKNNYEINVMNGEEGYVQNITETGVGVVFKETLYTFNFDENKQEDKDETLEELREDAKKGEDEAEELLTSDLIHSFAISIHKSQGSEADYVILFIPDDRSFNSFLNINLLYTAITRTRKCIWIVSSTEILGKISITQLQNKTDGLSDRLRALRNEENEKIMETLVLSPEFNVSLNNNTSLTTIPSFSDYDDINQDELFELYDDEW